MEKEGSESEISFKSDHRVTQKKSIFRTIFGSCLPDTSRTDLHNTIPFKYFSCCLTPQEK